MAITEIEINTSTLGTDIETLETTLGQLEIQVEAMFTSVSELDRMWDGPANDAFNQQFRLDYQICVAMCQTLKELIESLRYAKGEYEKCEQSIDGLIRSIQI